MSKGTHAVLTWKREIVRINKITNVESITLKTNMSYAMNRDQLISSAILIFMFELFLFSFDKFGIFSQWTNKRDNFLKKIVLVSGIYFWRFFSHWKNKNKIRSDIHSNSTFPYCVFQLTFFIYMLRCVKIERNSKVLQIIVGSISGIKKKTWNDAVE